MRSYQLIQNMGRKPPGPTRPEFPAETIQIGFQPPNRRPCPIADRHGQACTTCDEQLSLFFAQPQVLALFRQGPPRRFAARHTARRVVPHKVMPGKKPARLRGVPSWGAKLTAVVSAQLIALFFIPSIRLFTEGPSSGGKNRLVFDQWGVELGQNPGHTLPTVHTRFRRCVCAPAKQDRLSTYALVLPPSTLHGTLPHRFHKPQPAK